MNQSIQKPQMTPMAEWFQGTLVVREELQSAQVLEDTP
jgi:hypothetical protein